MTGSVVSASSHEGPLQGHASLNTDTTKERQLLYKGIVWSNIYHRFIGNQYLFSEDFLPSEITFDGHTFRNVNLRYDIVSDELMIPLGLDEIIQLNKEMVDSFTLNFDKREYHFKNIRNDSILGEPGYFNVLYEGNSSLYVRFSKRVMTVITDKSDGYFEESRRLLLLMKGKVYRITSMRDIYTILPHDADMIRDYIHEQKLKVRRKNPGSFVPVIRYIDKFGGEGNK